MDLTFARTVLVILMTLSLSALLAILGAGLAVQPALADGDAVFPPTPFFTPEPVTFFNNPLEIDFETVVSVPDALRHSLRAALEAGRAFLPPYDRFTVTALRVSRSDQWARIVLAPTHVVEAGWEVDWWADDLAQLLARREESGAWIATLYADPAFAQLAQDVPAEFIDFADLPDVPSYDYAFPWTGGQYWYRTWGWHSGDALDFQPVIDTDPYIHLAVLASTPGRLTEVCNDGFQSAVQVEHATGATMYFHLDADSIRRDLLGQQVEGGQFLGVLYSGTEGIGQYNGWFYRYWTGCGGGTGHHLHFVLPERDVVIGGVEAEVLAAGEPYVYPQYISTTMRLDFAR